VAFYDVICRQTSNVGTEFVQFTSDLRYDNMDRFELLYDHIYELRPGYNPDTGSSNLNISYHKFEFKVDLEGRQTDYSNNTTPTPVIGDIAGGSLLLCYRVIANTAYTSVNVTGAHSRLRYYD